MISHTGDVHGAIMAISFLHLVTQFPVVPLDTINEFTHFLRRHSLLDYHFQNLCSQFI